MKFVLLLLTLTAQTTETSPIEGIVRNRTTGAPIPNVKVSCGESATTSNESGQFQLALPPSSRCMYSVVAEGYFPEPKPIFHSPGTTPAANPKKELFMVPAASLSGIVATKEKQPVEGATVYLLAIRPRPQGRQLQVIETTSTASDGSFRFDPVQPANYLLLASPPRKDNAKLAFAPTYFPNSVSDSAAAPITLQPGSKQSSLTLEVQRQRTYLVTGKIRANDPLMDITRFITLTLARNTQDGSAVLAVDPVRTPLSEPFSRILLAADGQFQIEGVFSGTYDLILKSKLAYTRQLALSFEVSDRDITGLKADYLAPSRVTGKVVIPGEPVGPLPGRITLADPDNLSQGSTLASINPDGSFLIPALGPGKYQAFIFFAWPDKTPYYLESLEWNGTPQRGLTFENAGFPDNKLTIHLAAGRAKISLTAPQEASQAFLFPVPTREIDTMAGAAKNAKLGKNGKFEFDRVLPGKYTLCAFDSTTASLMDWVNDPRNATAIEKSCLPTEVKPNDSLNLNLPRLLSIEEPTR